MVIIFRHFIIKKIFFLYFSFKIPKVINIYKNEITLDEFSENLNGTIYNKSIDNIFNQMDNEKDTKCNVVDRDLIKNVKEIFSFNISETKYYMNGETDFINYTKYFIDNITDENKTKNSKNMLIYIIIGIIILIIIIIVCIIIKKKKKIKIIFFKENNKITEIYTSPFTTVGDLLD